MDAVLYVSHGSRKKEATEQALDFLSKVQEEIGIPLFERCFLELAEPDIEEGIHRLVKKGATRIAVLPVLLLSAGHYFEDIPEELDKAKLRFPGVELHYGEPLGVQERIIDVLVDRVRDIVAGNQTPNILLVGRGSRHPSTRTAMEFIGERLRSKAGADSVHVCYLAAITPSYDEAFHAVLESGKPTVVVPYLWFTGVLLRSMEAKVQKAAEQGYAVKISGHLNDHPHMIEAMADRVKETLVGMKTP